MARNSVAFFATLLFALPIFAADGGLPGKDANGWHSWTIDSAESTTVTVRLKDGIPVQIRTQHNNCWSHEPIKAKHHGVVSSTENFRWFRRFVEDKAQSRQTRNSALFGIAQSDSDEAFGYLDTLITG